MSKHKLAIWACVAVAFVGSIACDAIDRWGTPDYFERIVGVPFVPASPVPQCRVETGVDFVAFRQIPLPESTVQSLRRQPRSLAALPHQLPYERRRRLQTWTQAPFSAEAREAFDLALAGAIAAVEESRCDVIGTDAMSTLLSKSLASPTTFYMFQYQQVEGRVLAEALEFRILDLADGVLFELVNFS